MPFTFNKEEEGQGNPVRSARWNAMQDAIVELMAKFNNATPDGHGHSGAVEDGPQITEAGIADGAITTDKIQDGAITSNKLSANFLSNITVSIQTLDLVDGGSGNSIRIQRPRRPDDTFYAFDDCLFLAFTKRVRTRGGGSKEFDIQLDQSSGVITFVDNDDDYEVYEVTGVAIAFGENSLIKQEG